MAEDNVKKEEQWSPAAVMAAAALAVAILGSLVGIVVAVTFSKEPSPQDIAEGVRGYCNSPGDPCRSVVPGPATELPPGFIAAFEKRCPPESWKPFRAAEGRMLVGAGNADGKNKDMGDNPLTARPAGKTGGEETHQLTVSELPSHTHTFSRAKHVFRRNGDNGAAEIPGQSDTTNATGGNKPHNNMPPFVSVQFCIKS